jgi:hypothetical protein
MTIETVPMFVVNDTPPLLDFSRYDVNIAQHSGGLGPLAGATLGVNFWLNGKRPLKGSFLGVGITNYTLDYEAFEADGTTRADFISHTERQLYFFYGSFARYGAFIIGGGIGFGYDVNNETQCLASNTFPPEREPGNCDAIQLAVPDPGNSSRAVAFDVTGFLYPWDLMTRFSLGIAID